MKMLARTADDLIGTFRMFGADGPVYRVIGKAGETKVRITVVESGEELDYLLARAHGPGGGIKVLP